MVTGVSSLFWIWNQHTQFNGISASHLNTLTEMEQTCVSVGYV